MSKQPELTEADRKAIKEWLENTNWSSNLCAENSFEAGILHARANDDPGPEWVASNILEGAAKRIAELEAEVARLTQKKNKLQDLYEGACEMYAKDVQSSVQSPEDKKKAVNVHMALAISDKIQFIDKDGIVRGYWPAEDFKEQLKSPSLVNDELLQALKEFVEFEPAQFGPMSAHKKREAMKERAKVAIAKASKEEL
jgi:hypothetical protein